MTQPLTVATLREQLARLPQDLPVYVYDDWYDFPCAPVSSANVEDAAGDSTPGDGLARPQRLVLHAEH